MKFRDSLVFVAFAISLLLGLVYHFFEHAMVLIVTRIVDGLIMSLLWLHLWLPFHSKRYTGKFLQQYTFQLTIISLLTIFYGIVAFPNSLLYFKLYNVGLMFQIIKNFLLFLLLIAHVKHFSKLTRHIILNSAQTLTVSFLVVIAVGVMLLMLPLAAPTQSLSFMEALFTATSAVCVTGLSIIDVGTRLSFFGQFVLVALIQIGGLGFMVLSIFGIMALNKKISLEDKMTVSYAISEDDMTGLLKTLRVIIGSTFAIEAIAALFLMKAFARYFGFGFKAVWYGLFHAVSAFCNAGFALFANNFEAFTSDVLLSIVTALTIILGGISFGVIKELTQHIKTILSNLLQGRKKKCNTLSLNTYVVLKTSAILLTLSFVFIYFLEHTNTMKTFSLGKQYLATFFQAVTLRTAGFSTISFNGMGNATLFFMIFIMFIGGASGSTAGGIKVNTIATVLAFFRSFLQQEKQTKMRNLYIAFQQVEKAFLILGFGLASVILGVFLLTITESASFLAVFFEVVSAFATVGLSTGITAGLSPIGKYIIIVLMFIGRVGPLTILTAARKKRREYNIEYAYGNVALG